MEGRKDDKGKLELYYLDFEFLEGVARVLQHGSEKYSPENWKKLSYRRILGAFLRHAFAIAKGEDYDKDSGMLHILHAATNLMFMYYFKTKEQENDNKGKITLCEWS